MQGDARRLRQVRGAIQPAPTPRTAGREVESAGSRNDVRNTVAVPDASNPLPAGHRLRRPNADDAPSVAALKRAAEVARHGETDVTPAQIVEEWALPRLVPDEDLWLIEAQSGEVVGYALVWMEDPPNVFVADQTVHPEHRSRGLSELLLKLCEARAAGVAESAPGGAPANLSVWTHEGDTSRRAAFAGAATRRPCTPPTRRPSPNCAGAASAAPTSGWTARTPPGP